MTAIGLAKDAMLGSGYTSVMNSDAVKLGWAPWGDVPTILEIWDRATYVGEACSSIYQPWHFPWTDQLSIEVQKCLTGQITADQCCDNLIKGIADAKRKGLMPSTIGIFLRDRRLLSAGAGC